MNKITLKRERSKDIVNGQYVRKNVYVVKRVVGAISPYVGERLSKAYVSDLCEQTGVWVVTFI